MAALGESEGEAALARSEGNETGAQGPAAPPGAALPPQRFQSRPALVAEERQNQRLVVAAEERGQPGEAPPGTKAASELVLSFGPLRQPAPRSAGPSLAAQESGFSAPPAAPTATRPSGGSTDPSTQPLWVVSQAPHNAAQQLQDVARRIALQRVNSEAAATALPPARLLPPQACLWSYRRRRRTGWGMVF